MWECWTSLQQPGGCENASTLAAATGKRLYEDSLLDMWAAELDYGSRKGKLDPVNRAIIVDWICIC